MSSYGKFYRKKYSSRRYKTSKKLKQAEFFVINSVAFILIIILAYFMRDFIKAHNKKVTIPLENISAFQIPTKTMTDLKTLSDKYVIDFAELLTIYCLENDFFPTKTAAPTTAEIEQNFIRNYDKIKSQYAESTIRPYYELFQNMANDIVYFPIPLNYDGEETPSYMYGDSWGASKKQIPNNKLFEGTNIYDRENMKGRIPVVSISAGTVTQIGWNDITGFTIVVETEKGLSLHYAHLDHFAENLLKGSKVKAGQLLGYMGNSGFGKKDNSAITAQVQLHVGISSQTDFSGKPLWINPYPFLRLKEASKVEYVAPK